VGPSAGRVEEVAGIGHDKVRWCYCLNGMNWIMNTMCCCDYDSRVLRSV
jgi:hypothetical protein